MLEIRPHDSLQKMGARMLYSSLFLSVGLRNRQLLQVTFCRCAHHRRINPDMQCDLTLLREPDHVHGWPVSPRSARPALSMGRWIANGDLLRNRSRNYSGTLLLVRRGPAPSTMSIQEVLWRSR